MTKKRKKDKEITIRAPDYIPKREPVFKDTTGTEALDAFKVAEMIGRFVAFIFIGVGILVIFLSTYNILMSINTFLDPLFMGVFGIVGVLNILGGMLLLAKK